LVILFAITLFFNAALLFIIEPLIAKMILPLLGGSPAVWNTTLVFYQTCLLAGYAYAHFGSAWLGTKRHALLHLNFLLGAVLLLPVVVPIHWFVTPMQSPVQLVLSVLCVSVGFPFLVVSAGSPLLQKWFAQCHHDAARDPYFLYAASNIGSMVGLVAYPILIEPNLTLTQQNHFWLYGYLGLLVLTSSCVLLYLRPLSRAIEPESRRLTTIAKDPELAPSWLRRLRWMVWALVPSSLLSGVTTYMTTDLVSAPLFWVVPLALYLFSFVVAFGRSGWTTSEFFVRRQAFLLLGAILTIVLQATEPVYVILPIHLAAFFATALLCHGQLASLRPSPRYLTDYYLWISLGGMLGSLFNAIIAPAIFTSVIEYSLAMAAAAFMRPYIGANSTSARQRRLDWALPALMSVLMLGFVWVARNSSLFAGANLRLLIYGITGLLCLCFAYRPIRFGAGIAALLVIAQTFPPPYGQVLYAERSFFGAYRATYDLDGNRYALFHGTTVHGAQSANESMRLQPPSYYHRTGPAGQVLRAEARSGRPSNIAIVGLGTGALACHGARFQNFTFYEIDPLVEKIARDDRWFTYLRDCPPKVEVVIGDARMTLVNAADRQYQLIVLDAFSSDVIPVHLLTREAVALYLSKTAADGALLFHISNRYMDLAPVLARMAREFNLLPYLWNDLQIAPRELAEGKSASRWILLAPNPQVGRRYAADNHWQRLDGSGEFDLWTDEFTDVLKVLRWR
jgi:hypothetical protein